MSIELNVLLREKITETTFILAKYQNYNSKNQWNCICSCMDWIDAGTTNIDKALDELKQSKGLETCIKFFQYLCCIDIVWEGICQLHRVFINDKSIPFQKDTSAFQQKYFPLSDNDYFKEIRACFGAHSVKLNKNEARRFASWSGHLGFPESMSVLIYNNVPNSGFTTVTVTIDELQNFYEKRLQYIYAIINAVDNHIVEYKQSMCNEKISRTDDIEAQIEILKEESYRRSGTDIYIDELVEIKNLLLIDYFPSRNNRNATNVEGIREKLINGIQEIYDSLQNMDFNCELEIQKFLYERKHSHASVQYDFEEEINPIVLDDIFD